MALSGLYHIVLLLIGAEKVNDDIRNKAHVNKSFENQHRFGRFFIERNTEWDEDGRIDQKESYIYAPTLLPLVIGHNDTSWVFIDLIIEVLNLFLHSHMTTLEAYLPPQIDQLVDKNVSTA